MKISSIHILFWILYLGLRCFIEFLWVRGTIPNIPETSILKSAILAAILESIPEIIFSYYFVYRFLQYLFNQKLQRIYIFLESIIVLLLLIYSVRIIVSHIIFPHIYNGHFPVSKVFEFKRFMAVLFNFIATSSLFIALHSVKLQFASKEREKNLIKEKLNTELKLLKSQTNPHFLFNTLNSIYSLALTQSEKTPESILKLSEILSFTLYESTEERIMLKEEIRIINDYIDLQRLRFAERFKVSIRKKIDDENILITPLLILPLVENAFKHGVSESRFGAYIDIEIILINSQLYVKIINSIERRTLNTGNTNIGIANLKRQLELTYKDQKFHTSLEKNIFVVTLNINLDSYGKI